MTDAEITALIDQGPEAFHSAYQDFKEENSPGISMRMAGNREDVLAKDDLDNGFFSQDAANDSLNFTLGDGTRELTGFFGEAANEPFNPPPESEGPQTEGPQSAPVVATSAPGEMGGMGGGP